MAAATAGNEVEQILNQAQLAELQGDRAAALALANKGVKLEPANPQCFYVRGRLFAAGHEPAKAIADFTQALQLEPRGAEIYQLRGFEYFKLAQFPQAIADFDRFLKFAPQQEAYHWHRGIAYYFAGRYEEGRKQFEMRQALGTNSLENAFWHFLCVARMSGLDKARAGLLPMQEDSGLVMRKIYDVLAGRMKPEEVLALAQANYASTAQLHRQLFFAHFYLGFYYEVIGDDKQALAHATEAAGQNKLDNFMGDVALVHARLLRTKKQG